MGGSAGGGSSKSRSSSKPVILPEQREIWEYFGTDIMPMARGEETALTRSLEQKARDDAAVQEGLARQATMEAATRTGMGSAQVASLQRQAREAAIQGTLKNIQQARMQASQTAMSMISGLPIGPSTQSKSKSSSWNFNASGGATGSS